MDGLNDCLPYEKLESSYSIFSYQKEYMAATKILLNDFFAAPFLSIKIAWLALSIRNSGMNVNELTLKLADKVVAKMLPPSGAALNIFNWLSSLKYSPRRVRPNQL